MAEEDSEFTIDAAHFDVMVAARQYQNTKNPMFLWKLIKACVDHQQPLPPVAMAYLGQVADRLFLCADPDGKRHPEKIQNDVFRAVFGETSGGGASPLRQFWKAEQDFAVAVSMEADMADRVVSVPGAEGEVPSVRVEKGASIKEAIERAKPLRPELSDDVSFRRAYKNSLPSSD